MPIPSSDDSRPDTVSNSHGSRRISREIAHLQQEIRDDFDQKLKELSVLMVKFRSLLANSDQLDSNQQSAANDSTLSNKCQKPVDQNVIPLLHKKITDATKDIPVLTDRVADQTTSKDSTEKDENVGTEKSIGPLKLVENNDLKRPEDTKLPPGSDNKNSATTHNKKSRFATEPARFESGLYQLNSQLYRFKLELDQELEFREEPLHIHFQHQSELARVLQQITEKMQQEKNTGH